jgi:hypothetical protein
MGAEVRTIRHFNELKGVCAGGEGSIGIEKDLREGIHTVLTVKKSRKLLKWI